LLLGFLHRWRNVHILDEDGIRALVGIVREGSIFEWFVLLFNAACKFGLLGLDFGAWNLEEILILELNVCWVIAFLV
jgi:hypothetical protein